MKKLILGIGMFIGGILGIIGVMLSIALDGFSGQNIIVCINRAGMMPYFIIFCLLAISGLYIAYKEAFNKS